LFSVHYSVYLGILLVNNRTLISQTPFITVPYPTPFCSTAFSAFPYLVTQMWYISILFTLYHSLLLSFLP
jgi:hypothetical protein